MKIKILAGLVAAAVLFWGALQVRNSVTLTENRAVIKKRGYTIEAVLSAPQEIRILLKDRGKLMGMNFADELVAVIPLDRADALKGRFGADMFRCDGAGSRELMSATRPLCYLATNRHVKDRAGEVLRLLPGKIPVVDVTTRDMTITSFRNFGIPFDVGQSNFGGAVLLTDIVLVADHYR